MNLNQDSKTIITLLLLNYKFFVIKKYIFNFKKNLRYILKKKSIAQRPEGLSLGWVR